MEQAGWEQIEARYYMFCTGWSRRMEQWTSVLHILLISRLLFFPYQSLLSNLIQLAQPLPCLQYCSLAYWYSLIELMDQ